MDPLFERRLTRRGLLAAIAAGTAGLAVGACGGADGPAAPATQPPAATPAATVTGAASPSPTAARSPSPTVTPPPASPTLAEMAGQVVLVGFRGTELTPANPIVADIRDRHIGAVILFSYDVPTDSPIRNIQSPAQVAALTKALLAVDPSRPLLICTDEEGGKVARLGPDHGFPPTQSAAELGRIGDPTVTREAGAAIGQTLASAGLNWDLAPVVDLNVNPANPIIGALGRSFSADPNVIIAQAGAFIDGVRSKGVLTCLKHFPGHGSSTADSHAGFVDVTNTWREAELAPYRALIPQGRADAILVAHVFNAKLDPDYPASLSKKTIDGLLRGQLGYNGPVVSDDLQMGAITQQYGFTDAIRLALNAGTDLLTFGNNLTTFDPELGTKATSAILGLVRAGDIPEARLREAFGRVRSLSAKAAGAP